MGIYINPGSEKFEEALCSEIYVDKTRMIRYLNSVVNTKQKYVAVSRPRRFGKTMAADMIGAYYDCSIDSRRLFEKRCINPVQKPAWMNNECDDGEEQAWDKYLNKFNVIHLDVVKFLKAKSVEACIERINKNVCRELRKAFPQVEFFENMDLQECLEEIYVEAKQKFVIIIDEWDSVFRKMKNDIEGQTAYLDFLRNLMKDEPYVALAYMTGILPIKKYGEHSALNMFDEYSMISPKELLDYVGFTEDEVRDICNAKNVRFEGIKKWYDGYRLTNAISAELVEDEKKVDKSLYRTIDIYSPLSVVNAVRHKKLEAYWNETETGEALKEYIRRNYDGLKEDVAVLMQGKKIPVDVSTYQNDMTTFNSKDDIFTLFIHLGYLGYDSESYEVFIPNREVAEVFGETTKGGEWSYLFQAIRNSQKLLEATWNGDEKLVAKLVENAHMRAGNQTYNSEAALSYAVRLAYFAADQYYTLIPEMQAGKGYADLVYIPSPQYPDKPALLIELKWNKDDETAIDQIKNRRYPDSLDKYKGNIILVGINYDKEVKNTSPEFKNHSCRIDRA